LLKLKRKLSSRKVFYRVNQYIQAKEVRVIDEKGKQIGTMTLPEAMKKTNEAGVDLVEIAPKAVPPVCKIIDFKKFLFQEAKKQARAKKGAKKGQLKEVRLTPFIAENDLQFRLKRAREFLTNGHKVKISIFFKGRELDKKEFGYKLIGRVTEELKDLATVDAQTKFIGRKLETLFRPLK
jgi:translation initiation factor IF-3